MQEKRRISLYSACDLDSYLLGYPIDLPSNQKLPWELHIVDLRPKHNNLSR